MNIYRYQFIVACPNNDGQIIYQLKIEATKMILVEHVVTACALFKRAFHEDIADELFRRFGERQTINAHHHGVDVETLRGFE